MQITIHESDTTLSQLVDRVNAGEEIILHKGGIPVAKLVSYASSDESFQSKDAEKKRIQQESIEQTNRLFEGVWGNRAEEIDDYIRCERESWKKEM